MRFFIQFLRKFSISGYKSNLSNGQSDLEKVQKLRDKLSKTYTPIYEKSVFTSSPCTYRVEFNHIEEVDLDKLPKNTVLWDGESLSDTEVLLRGS